MGHFPLISHYKKALELRFLGHSWACYSKKVGHFKKSIRKEKKPCRTPLPFLGV